MPALVRRRTPAILLLLFTPLLLARPLYAQQAGHSLRPAARYAAAEAPPEGYGVRQTGTSADKYFSEKDLLWDGAGIAIGIVILDLILSRRTRNAERSGRSGDGPQ